MHRRAVKLDNSAHATGMQHNVEDSKAGKYEKGRLLVTTLRLIWFSSQSTAINLCIGIHTIHKLDMSSKARSGAPLTSVWHARLLHPHAYLCCQRLPGVLLISSNARPAASTRCQRADVPPLHIFAMFKDTKFEFIFTPASRAQSHMLLQTVELLVRAFTATSRVREVRMRGAHCRRGAGRLPGGRRAWQQRPPRCARCMLREHMPVHSG
jgi:Bardet-Biedl syndrome 5 protein